MTRTALAVTHLATIGATLAFVASDQVNGNSVYNDGYTALLVKNTSGATVTLTIGTNNIQDGDLTLPPRVVTIAPTGAGEIGKVFGPFSQAVYSQADGTVSLNCSASLQFAAFSLV